MTFVSLMLDGLLLAQDVAFENLPRQQEIVVYLGEKYIVEAVEHPAAEGGLRGVLKDFRPILRLQRWRE